MDLFNGHHFSIFLSRYRHKLQCTLSGFLETFKWFIMLTTFSHAKKNPQGVQAGIRTLLL